MKTNYNYKYIAVSHSLNIVWGIGTTEEEALRDAMGWMSDSSDDDIFRDYDLFRESQEYDDLDLIGITEAALKSADEPTGCLSDWINAHEDIVYVNQIQSIMTGAECEAFYRGDDQ